MLVVEMQDLGDAQIGRLYEILFGPHLSVGNSVIIIRICRMQSTQRRLENLYTGMRECVERNGIDVVRQEMIRKNFFSFKNHQWIPKVAFHTPSGLTLGNPFIGLLRRKLVDLRREIIHTMDWPNDFYWAEIPQRLHTTLISYFHYSEMGNKLICIPKIERSTVEKIVHDCPPVDIDFSRILLTLDGALLLLGTVKTEDIFILRDRCRKEISGITQKPLNIIHIKLLQLLKPISKETICQIHSEFGSRKIGRYAFQTALTCWGNRLRFGTKASNRVL